MQTKIPRIKVKCENEGFVRILSVFVSIVRVFVLLGMHFKLKK